MNIYTPEGWLNFPKIDDYAEKNDISFIMIDGGRATGKTFGAVDLVLVDKPCKFIWMRRTLVQLELINKPELNPFKKNYKEGHLPFEPCMQNISKYNAGIYVGEQDDEGRLVPTGAPLGYTAALSTFSNIRGFDASDVDVGIFDEFIPERTERPLRDEFGAFCNAYETINRNRELEGKKPLRFYCLANSNDIGNPLYIGFGLVKTRLNMRKTGENVHIDKKRGIMLVALDDSPISREKEDTALYRATRGSSFYDMSINNIFDGEKDIRSISRPLREYKPIVGVGELTVYKHKANKLPLYCTFHRSGSPILYGSSDTELERFARKYAWLWLAYMESRIEFEEYAAELLFQRYFK